MTTALKADGRSGSAGGEDEDDVVAADIDEGAVEEICGLVAGDGVTPGVEDNAAVRDEDVSSLSLSS